MKKFLIVLQGNITKETLKYARSYKDLDLDLVLVIWDKKLDTTLDNYFIIERLSDPTSILTKDNKNFVNLNRQIAAIKFILDKYSNKYEYIVKIRNDIICENINKFKRNLINASKKNKIWTITTQTGSPRFFSPLLLSYHVSDWFFGGKPYLLKKNLQLDLIDEEYILLQKPLIKKNLIFWRKASNEQTIWKTAWDLQSKNNINTLKIYSVGTNPTLKECFANSKYLFNNYYISNLKDIGLQSKKYPVNLLTFYRNRYSIFELGKLESFFINNNLIILSVFYFPFIRFIIYKIFQIIKKNNLRF